MSRCIINLSAVFLLYFLFTPHKCVSLLEHGKSRTVASPTLQSVNSPHIVTACLRKLEDLSQEVSLFGAAAFSLTAAAAALLEGPNAFDSDYLLLVSLANNRGVRDDCFVSG